MTKKRINPAGAPKPVGPYSQGIIAGGLLFVSGQIPIDPATGQIVPGGIEAETEQVMKNLVVILSDAGMGWKNVAKATVYLADIQDFESMNGVYARYLGEEAPARSTLQAAGLPKGARVEIELVAAF